MMEFQAGIFFGLPEDEYRAIRALSSSGVRDLLVSPLDYWANSPMNPDYEDAKTEAMIVGTAFHRRLLEPERFTAIYAAQPSKDEFPDAIDGGKALAAECERLALKKSGTIEQLCDRILEKDPKARLWPVIEQGILANLDGRTLLKRNVIADIERMTRIVMAHQSAAKALSGGFTEVSIFWTDEETGIPLKARIDNLKTKAIVDVKSFNNPLSKPVDSAVASAVANGRYDVQAAVYDAAVTAAKQMLRKQKSAALHIPEGLEIETDWLTSFAACASHTFVFVFIEQGPVTNVRVREFRKTETYGGQGASQNMYWQSGHAGFREGVRRYVENMERHGPDKPWIDDQPMRAFADQDFPLWLFN